ncbi:MAG: hypothetical protein EOP49_27560 [Sphingobacteriales bacterium]|nr:MAG: hypothetical protein EOP49_27560 [Sphingobacteriales bacterium]
MAEHEITNYNDCSQAIAQQPLLCAGRSIGKDRFRDYHFKTRSVPKRSEKVYARPLTVWLFDTDSIPEAAEAST